MNTMSLMKNNRWIDAAECLVGWYLKNRRDLPWRKTKDPYKIWISEIMLQQTRVDTVIQYYLHFLERFQTIQALAAAPEQEILTVWKGLGYYSRAMNLQKAAQQIVRQYDGVFPMDYIAIRQLPGIGEYTAGAIASIAFDQPYPAVDGNVLRVISRLAEIEEDITQSLTKKKVTEIVNGMIPGNQAGDFTQALMELGAIICVPTTPLCNTCPVQAFCAAYQSKRQNELPVKKKKEAPRVIDLYVAVLRQNDKILLEYRKSDRLLGKLWGLPMVEKRGACSPEELIMGKYGLHLYMAERIGMASHTFTHQVWKMDVFAFHPEVPILENDLLHWMDVGKLDSYAIPMAFQRVLKLLSL